MQSPESLAMLDEMVKGALAEHRAGKTEPLGDLVAETDQDEPSLDELLSRVTPENRHAETDWGPSVSQEFH